MKKLFFVMAAVAALLTDCSKDDTFGGPTRGKVTFEVSTPELATRYGEGDNATKLYYAVYDMVENGAKVHESTTTLTNGAADVKIDLVEGRKYTAIFWADADSKSPYKFDAANKTVSYKDNVTLTANNEDYDAFYAFVPQDAIKVGETVDVDLKRPFAQLNIATNDTQKAKDLQVEVVNTAVTVAGVYTSFNLENGQVQGEPTTVNFTSAAKANGQIEASEVTYDLLAMNYLLVNPDNETLVDVTFNFTDMVGTEEENYVRQYNDIKVQRNYRTNVIGSILTDETIFDVDIEEGFLTPDKTEEGNDSATQVVSNAQDLQEMINNAKDGEETTLVLDGDIILNVDTRAEAVTYINIPAKKNITLDLNGYTISGTDKNTSDNYYLIDNRGTLTILDNSVAKDGIINLTATTDRDWNASSVVVANNPGGKLTVNGGTIEHLGGTDMAYGIDNLTNGKGTYAETIINGGTVKSTYRAIRQFLNGVEAQNILTVNGGTIESTGNNKSIWMQNANNNNNPGTLVVGGEDAIINSGILISYSNAANDNISASVAAEALKDGSEVLLSSAPEGYDVFENNGVWTVGKVATIDAQGVYHIADVAGLKWFAAQVNAENTFKGKTVELDADIDLQNEQWTPIGTKANPFMGTFDGGNYTVSNLKIENLELLYAGLFGYAQGATIKNVKVENVDIKAYSQVGSIAGTVYTGTVENCHVSGSIYLYADYAYAGGIASEGYVTVKNCSVIAKGTGTITVKEKTMAGGITGWRGEGNNGIYNCTVKNLEISAYQCVGAISGLVHYDNTITNCTAENVKLTKTRQDGQASIGLAAGCWAKKANENSYTITITNNTFNNISLNGSAAKVNSDGEDISSFLQDGQRLIGSNYSYYINIPDNNLVANKNSYNEIFDNLTFIE